MYRFLELLISVVIVVLLFVLVGVLLPSERTVQHEVETNYPIRMVFDTLNGFRRFPDWHPLRAHDPTVRYRLAGPTDRGVGAKLLFESDNPKVGSGSYEIIDSVDLERIEFAIENNARGENKHAEVTFEQQGKTVTIRWTYNVQYGWDLIGRYAGLYVNRTAGDDIKSGLGNFVGLLATMPRFDYSNLEVAIETIPAQHILYTSLSADRNITAVENAMIKGIADLKKAMADNRLQAAGPVRLITTNFGSDKYEFDVAIPFQVPEGARLIEPAATTGEAPAPAAAPQEAPAEGQAQVDAATTPPPAPAAPSLPLVDGLRLPENVKQGAGYGGRVLTTQYQGHPAALPLLRDQLRAYAATYGYPLQDRAFEEYLTDIQSTAAEDAEFKVYWPIR